MNWWDDITSSVSSVYDNVVDTGTDYLNTSIDGFTSDPAPTQTTGSTGRQSVSTAPRSTTTKTAETSGLFGYSWSVIASIATVFGVLVVVLRSK